MAAKIVNSRYKDFIKISNTPFYLAFIRLFYLGIYPVAACPYVSS